LGGAGDYPLCVCFNGVTQAASQVQAERMVREYLGELRGLARRRARSARRAA
jgi:hypothetical protein